MTTLGRTALWDRAADFRATAADRAPGRLGPLVERRVRELLAVGAESVPPLPDDLDEAERVVLDVTEQFIVDVHGITDAGFARLGEHYGPDEQVAIMFHLALVDGFAKLELAAGSPPSGASTPAEEVRHR